MALSKEQKIKIVEKLKNTLAQQKALFFVNFQGVKTKDIFDLRNALKKNLMGFKVVKKTLLGLSLKDIGINLEKDKLEGQIAIAFGQDEIALSKFLYRFSQKLENLKIAGGYFKDKKFEFLPEERIIELAKLPTRDELLGKLTWTLSSPISQLINLGSANIKGLILVLNTIKK